MGSNYFETIENDWAGFSSEHTFTIPYFEKDVEIFLGSEFDDDGDEIETAPTKDELLEYEYILKSFFENIDEIINHIKEKAFKYYKRIYAKYYENEFIVESFFETNIKEGETHKPLNIDTPDKHFEYMKYINYIRVLRNNKIIIPILYKLDGEHGLEILLQGNKIINISGIGEN